LSRKILEAVMKAAVLVEPGKLVIDSLAEPTLKSGEVLIRMRAAGLCGSDYTKWQGLFGGPYGIAPGHEGAGEIVQIGPGVAGRQVGERVVIQPNIPCGTCLVCRGGRENTCPQKIRMGIDVSGVLAEYAAVPARLAWPLPDNLSFAEGTLAEPLAVALHGFKMAPAAAGERVLIYGAGAIGLFYVRLAVLAGAEVSALDIAPPRLEAAGRLGAARIYSSLEEIKQAGASFEVIYETSGQKSALAETVNLASPGGRILLCGLPKEEYPLATTTIVRKELTIYGSIIYRDEFPQALALLAGGQIPAEIFITGRHRLEEAAAALADFPSPRRIKEIITIS
jgi:2-desacetyl-2-hydroxyethyl bacteriochlorophyllide A dehydrogenase